MTEARVMRRAKLSRWVRGTSHHLSMMLLLPRVTSLALFVPLHLTIRVNNHVALWQPSDKVSYVIIIIIFFLPAVYAVSRETYIQTLHPETSSSSNINIHSRMDRSSKTIRSQITAHLYCHGCWVWKLWYIEMDMRTWEKQNISIILWVLTAL